MSEVRGELLVLNQIKIQSTQQISESWKAKLSDSSRIHNLG